MAAEGDRANVKLVNCVITKNQATSLGGGLAFVAPTGTGSLMVPEMMNTIVTANTAVSGGGNRPPSPASYASCAPTD